jgi:hypothetical protein
MDILRVPPIAETCLIWHLLWCMMLTQRLLTITKLTTIGNQKLLIAKKKLH